CWTASSQSCSGTDAAIMEATLRRQSVAIALAYSSDIGKNAGELPVTGKLRGRSVHFAESRGRSSDGAFRTRRSYCRKSRRTLPIYWWSFATLAFAFFQLLMK
ncbi:MAG: hypothetical protein U0989_06645, partial [Azonexus sp.]|nr:hypothetical protein [Azonexus sp.]